MAKLKQDDVAEVSELAWERLAQAIRTGAITIGARLDIPLGLSDYIEICKWAAIVKIKKPQVVTTPEDFHLSSTEGEDA